MREEVKEAYYTAMECYTRLGWVLSELVENDVNEARASTRELKDYVELLTRKLEEIR